MASIYAARRAALRREPTHRCGRSLLIGPPFFNGRYIADRSAIWPRLAVLSVTDELTLAARDKPKP